MSEQLQRFYEFGDFLLDAQERLLFRDGEPLDLSSLRPQAAATTAMTHNNTNQR